MDVVVTDRCTWDVWKQTQNLILILNLRDVSELDLAKALSP